MLNRHTVRTIIYILFGLFILGCSNGQTTKNKEISTADTFLLPDSLFPFKDIKNSVLTDNFFFDKESFILYTDSTKKTPFIHLDSLQKLKFIAPIIIEENKGNPNIDANYVVNYMNALFVSKQKIIYDFTPIIVSVSGDDYDALFYILLDKSLNPISNYRINGGFCAGPWDGPDSTLQMCPNRQSFFKGREISSYEVTEFIRPDSVKQLAIVDSVNYLSKILPSGQIETQRLDSTRYERMSKW